QRPWRARGARRGGAGACRGLLWLRQPPSGAAAPTMPPKQVTLHDNLVVDRDQPVQYVQENPKKSGGKSYERYERYKVARTIGQAFDLDAVRGDIFYDHKHGFLKLLPKEAGSAPDGAARAAAAAASGASARAAASGGGTGAAADAAATGAAASGGGTGAAAGARASGGGTGAAASGGGSGAAAGAAASGAAVRAASGAAASAAVSALSSGGAPPLAGAAAAGGRCLPRAAVSCPACPTLVCPAVAAEAPRAAPEGRAEAPRSCPACAACEQPAEPERAAQSLGDVRYGDEVPGHVATAAAVRGRDLHILADGSALFVEEVPAAELEDFVGRAGAADARVMPVMRTGARREVTWAVVAARVREEDFERDWLVTGPRTTFWCIEFIDNEGMGIDGHHDRFRAVAKLEPTQWCVQEHFQCTQYIRLLLLSDQCDGTNLQACEAIFRRMQTIEYSYLEKVREREGAYESGKLSIEELTHFAGSTRISSSLMVCPDWLEFVRKEVEREAALAKNLRKAREEKEALKKGKKDGQG
ncbi:unnamed protein product, partial [Prorocentrum cordatum]